MNSKIKVYFSNRIEVLYQSLKAFLFGESNHPFSQRNVIVPSPFIKSWLMSQMANDPDLGIAAGVKISYLDETIASLNKNQISLQLPSALEISLAIETEIRQILENEDTSPQEKKIYAPLINYLKNIKMRKGERRLASLADKLAALFLQYGKYGERLTRQWEEDLVQENWQAALWKRIYHSQKYPWTYASKEISQTKQLNFPSHASFHLFALNHLAAIKHRFLENISQDVPVNYYLLSPCQMFWSDIVSDREKKGIQKYWAEKNIPQTQKMELDEYLRNRNSLLANFGRLGRETIKLIEESEAETFSSYFLPQKIKRHPSYQEICPISSLFFDNDSPFLTCLEAIQADMLLMRHPEESDPVSLSKEDSSFQIHAASSPAREVEILYNNLLKIIDDHKGDRDPIKPEDILVMAPNVQEYEPFIKSIFGNEESLLDFQVMDLSLPSQNQEVQAYLHLISLPFSRWEALTILQLLDYPSFISRQKISLEESLQIKKWVIDAEIRWGHDVEHRNELLHRDHCSNKILEGSPSGTWDNGLSRLVISLALQTKEGEMTNTSLDTVPLDTIDLKQSELLGKWMEIIRSLKADLKPLVDGSTLTIREWAAYLECLYEAYFDIDSTMENPIFEQIKDFQKASRFFAAQKFSFNTIQKHILKRLTKQDKNYREMHLHAVRFCSMLPMRAIPAKVLVLMGMQEGSFPKGDSSFSLDMLKNNPDGDYSPSQNDFDRYLFLEALLSARQYLLMSYVGYSGNTKPALPSLLISELLAYLDKAYTFEGEKPSKKSVFVHPFHSFDYSYFLPDSPLKSYFQGQFKNALSHYKTEKKEVPLFTDFSIKITGLEYEEKILDIKQLASFAKNPLKAYFQSRGIYLKEEETNEDELLDFTLPHLEGSILKKAALKQPIDYLLDLAEKKGKLPGGVFKKVAQNKICQEVFEIKENLEKNGVDLQDIFDFEMSNIYSSPKQDEEGNWFFPPLEIEMEEGKRIKIIGKLEGVTTRGLISHYDQKRSGDLKICPQFLVYHCLIQKYNLPFEAQVLFTKAAGSKKALSNDPFMQLKKYLSYYYCSLNNPSPLIPEWIDTFLDNTPEEIGKILEKKLKDSFTPFYNSHIKWIYRLNLPSQQRFSEEWKATAQDLLNNLFDKYLPQKKQKTAAEES